MKIKLLLFSYFIVASVFSFKIRAADPNVKGADPNIIIILADDLGYGSVNLNIKGLHAFNNPHIKTPNLSRLAKESLVMTSHYASSPVCSPSRAGLLTGRTPTRCNINMYINDKKDNGKMFLHGSEITIAELLKRQGYQTAIFGKWHLNGADWEKPENWNGWTGSFPKQQGFDHGIVTKENPHLTRKLEANTQKHPGDFFDVNGKPVGPIKGYTSDIISRYACDWIGKAARSGKPFFAYLPFDAVHIRVAAADKYEALYHTGDARRDTYYANITHLDAAIGRVMDYLDELNIAENTIVIFSSDHGPAVMRSIVFTSFNYGTSYPMSGSKFQLYEGGIRVPGMVRWPKKIEPRVSDVPNSTVDLLPTFCELTNQSLPDDRSIDGVSLLDYWLSDKPLNREKPLYWQFENSREYAQITGEGYERRHKDRARAEITPHVCIRDGEYVMLAFDDEKFETPTDFKLFNIVTDPWQTTDLASKEKAQFDKMKTRLLDFYQDVNKDRLRTVKAIENKEEKIIFR